MIRRGYLRSIHRVFVTLTAVLVVTPVSAKEYAFVLSTDYYSAAYYSTIEVLPPRTADVGIAPVSTDPVVHYDVNEDMVFIVNRYLADNIQIVDTGPGFSTIGQYSVGNGSNPHDIRLASSEKAYVSRFEWKTLLIVHPYTGDSLGVIDLSPFADADGIPEMDRMEMVDGKLFVTLNSIDHTTWQPDGPGKIAVIDTDADTLMDCDPNTPGIQPITLQLPNPYSELRYDPCRMELIVGCLGSWGVLDGGVEAIDPYALGSTRVIITEEQIAGDIYDALLSASEKGYAVVLDTVPWPDNYARLIAFHPVTGEIIDTLYQQTSGTGSSLATIELNRQRELYLCDRDIEQPGIRIYDELADTLIAIIDVGVPPFDVAFLQLPFAGSSFDPRQDQLPKYLLHQNHPNPFNHSTKIRYTIAEAALSPAVRLDVFDTLGRLVRTLVDDEMSVGEYSVHWDGRDRYGSSVASGVYFYRLRCNGLVQTKRMVLTR